METFEEFKSKQIESAAYYEAGHMVAAVVQAMPVRAHGLYVDLYDNGVARSHLINAWTPQKRQYLQDETLETQPNHQFPTVAGTETFWFSCHKTIYEITSNYFDRPETDVGMTLLDMKERKLTIIALFAAHAAQMRFYGECEQTGWSKDLERIGTLSRQIDTDEEAQISIRRELWERAAKLIDRHWPIVEELAKALLAKPCTAMPLGEIALGWGVGPHVRHLSGFEVVDFFARHNIPAKVVDDATRAYDTTQDIPHYDSLA